MRVAVKETTAALIALIAYVATVLPRVRRELRRWRRAAEALPDLGQRRRALAALEEKRSNVEAVAVFASLAPLRRRGSVVRSIVSLQLAIDYRDVLEEAGEGAAPLDGFLSALETDWAHEIERLTGWAAVAPTLHAAVDRCADGQRRTHAAAGEVELQRRTEADHGGAELRRWAEGLVAPGDYRWWELAAGASSSVAAHALIAAEAAPDTTAADAAAIDAAYNPSIGALTVFLDDLVDREADREAGEHNYLAYYEGSGEAAERLAWIAEEAGSRIAYLPHASRHRAILAGVGAFYLSDAAAQTPYAQPIRRRLLAALGPGTRALSAFTRLRG